MDKVHTYIKNGFLGIVAIYGLYLLVSGIQGIYAISQSISFSSSDLAASELRIFYRYIANAAVMAILGILAAIFSYRLFRKGDKESYYFVMSGIGIFWGLNVFNPNGLMILPLVISIVIFIYLLIQNKRGILRNEHGADMELNNTN